VREGVTDVQTLFTHYRQVKNPNPVSRRVKEENAAVLS
jgi:hypothetical protein